MSIPLIGSPTALNIQDLSWANGRVTLTTVLPHGYKIGSTITLSVAGSSPDAYNGTFKTLVTGSYTLSYLLADDPGQVLVLGSVSYGISMIGGYFSSTLIYREAAQQFEVSP